MLPEKYHHSYTGLDVSGLRDGDVQEMIQALLKNRSRNARYRLHQHFKKFDSVEEAKLNRPAKENLTTENWDDLCNYWSDPNVEDAMIQLLEKSKLEGKPLSHGEVYDQVCGTRSGYIKALGYGPKPKRNQHSSNEKLKRLKESIHTKNAEMKKLASEVDELKSGMEEQRKIYTSIMERHERLIDLLMSKAT